MIPQTNSKMDQADGLIKSAINSVKNESECLMHEAQNLSNKGVEAAKGKINDIEDSVMNQTDALAEYIKNQPIKSILIALGTGYALSYLSKKS